MWRGAVVLKKRYYMALGAIAHDDRPIVNANGGKFDQLVNEALARALAASASLVSTPPSEQVNIPRS